jgi:GNAT superfamily N-acetyltransferase
MLAVQNMVHRQHFQSMYDYVRNRLKVKPIRQVTDLVWQLDANKYARLYIIFDQDKPIGWLYLCQRKGWAAWEVYQSWVFPEYRGNKYGEALYRAAIDADDLLLASGNTHSKYSQSVWKSFVKKNLFNTWAQDFKNLDSFCSVGWNEELEEIDCALPIYASTAFYDYAYHQQDVRLLATRKT